MHPFSWPYVLYESAHHKLEDALAQKDTQDSITKTSVVCSTCGYEPIDQGLCESCGDIIS